MLCLELARGAVGGARDPSWLCRAGDRTGIVPRELCRVGAAVCGQRALLLLCLTCSAAAAAGAEVFGTLVLHLSLFRGS